MLIDDGCTRPGYITAQEGLHESLRFRFHPMIPEEVDAVDDAVERNRNERGHAVIQAAVVKHLREWDLVWKKDVRVGDYTGKKGTPVPIRLEMVRILPYRAYNKLYRIIAGLLPTDPDPEATPDEESAYVQDLLESATSGRPAGDVATEREEGN